MDDPKIAVHINLFPENGGLLVVPFDSFDGENKMATEIGRFVIPWHELAGIIERMESIEKNKVERDAGLSPF